MFVDHEILRRDRPYDGAWTVTGCERRDGRWIVGIKSGAATGTSRADNYMLAPSDWVEPPIRPTFRAFYSVKELFGQAIREATADEEHQAALGHHYFFEHLRHVQPVNRGQGHGDHPQHHTNLALLNKSTDAKTPDA